MLKMGVPKAAVDRQKLLDGRVTSNKGIPSRGIPKPPPHPPPGLLPERSNKSTTIVPKINAI